MATARRDRPSGVDGVVPGGPPAAAIADPVAERRRDALMLLRRNSRACSRVIAWDISDGAILWLDQAGKPRTTFVTEVDGKPSLGASLHGFVV